MGAGIMKDVSGVGWGVQRARESKAQGEHMHY